MIAAEMRKLGLTATSPEHFTKAQDGLGRALVATLLNAKLNNDGKSDSTAVDPDTLPKFIQSAINKYTPGIDSDTGWAQFVEKAGLTTTKGKGNHADYNVYSSFDDGLAPNGYDEGGVAFLTRGKKIVAWAEVNVQVNDAGLATKVDIAKIFFKAPTPEQI
jgi:hypothetical protein